MEGDGRRYLSEGLQLMDNVMRRRTIGGLTMLKGYLPLGDSAYAYAISAGGVNIVRIVTDDPPAKKLDAFAVITKKPDFYSGVVTNGLLTTSVDGTVPLLAQFKPTPDCARLFKLDEIPQSVTKLSVRLYGGVFSELEAPEGSAYPFTQYELLKPTMYSGTMRKAVQLLMGFGKQAEKSIYEATTASTIEDDGDGSTPTVKPPTPYESEVAANGRQIRYDYRWLRTHGLVLASDDTWWLVEIGLTRGVVAMPLALHDATTTDEFLQQLVALDDAAGLAAVDEFGGFPTGESFASVPATFEAWVRAGKYLRLTPTSTFSTFYSQNFYSSSMGWAFNSTGTEAHNTSYDWNDDDGIQRGFHWAVDLVINANAPITPDPAAAAMKAEFSSVADDNPDTFEPNMYKLDRLTHVQIVAVQNEAIVNGIASGYAMLDAIAVVPLANGSGQPRLAAEGKIWWPTVFSPQIKFAEPLLNLCLSHDMRSDFRFVAVPPYCDTVMHVFFVEDELKACKFFFDPRTSPTKTDGDSEYDIEWNPVGDFNRVITTGPFGVPAMFYTTDFDDRAETGPVVQTLRWHRADQGWLNIVLGGSGFLSPSGLTNSAGPLDPDFPEGGDLSLHELTLAKNKWFTYEAWSDTRQSPSTIGAITVPFYDRCAYYYAQMQGHGGNVHSYSYSVGAMGSPYIGHFDRDNGFLHEPGTDPHNLLPEAQYHTVVDDAQPYQHFQDIADDGDWVPHGEDFQTVIYGADALERAQSLAHSETTNEPATKTLTVFLVCGKPGEGPLQSYTETRTGAAVSLWDSLWFLPSPDPDTGLGAAIGETWNGFGDSNCVIYQDTLNTLKKATILGAPNFDEMSVSSTFVGAV